jgi:exodeoxyribonuclease VII large subunit
LAASLAHLNPAAVLARGYSIVTDDQGEIVRDAEYLELSEKISVYFCQGQADAILTSITPDVSLFPATRAETFD